MPALPTVRTPVRADFLAAWRARNGMPPAHLREGRSRRAWDALTAAEVAAVLARVAVAVEAPKVAPVKPAAAAVERAAVEPAPAARRERGAVWEVACQCGAGIPSRAGRALLPFCGAKGCTPKGRRAPRRPRAAAA